MSKVRKSIQKMSLTRNQRPSMHMGVDYTDCVLILPGYLFKIDN